MEDTNTHYAASVSACLERHRVAIINGRHDTAAARRLALVAFMLSVAALCTAMLT